MGEGVEPIKFRVYELPTPILGARLVGGDASVLKNDMPKLERRERCHDERVEDLPRDRITLDRRS